jgi:hypothetical protein
VNQDIQRAVVSLFDLCFEITEAGRYQVTMTYQGSANGVFVTVYPACSDTVVFRDYVFISGMPFTTDKDVLDQLIALTAKVAQYRADEKEEAA